MLLTSLRLVNYRCYDDVTFDQIDRLAVFVGENDVGKTQLLNAIACLVGSGICAGEDYRDIAADERADSVTLEGTFRLEPHDTLPEEYRTGPSGAEVLRLTKHFRDSGLTVTCHGKGFSDSRFNTLKGSDHQKELLKAYNVPPAAREPERLAQLGKLRQRLIASGDLARADQQLELSSFAPLLPHMPRVERIASSDFRSPEDVVNRVLRDVAASVVKPLDSETGQPRERADLQAVRKELELQMNAKVREAEDKLRQLHKGFQGLTVQPSIEFARAVTTSVLNVDLGSGSRAAAAFGRGTNNRLWMGLLEWEREIARKTVSGSVIRLYDEPDVNLHYEAQRELFRTISALSSDNSLRTQCLVCTHAVTLIDRAAPETITLIVSDESLRRSARRLDTDGIDDFGSFMQDVGQAIGLSNTVLLYERAFLVVEGEGEQAALPVIYRNLYGHNMRDDGIVLVPLHGNGAWKATLSLLLRNRLGLTYMLLDADCKKPGSGMKLKAGDLSKLGCPDDFKATHVDYVGENEFEDAFSDDHIAAALEYVFPRATPLAWAPRDVGALRTRAKFSAALEEHVRDTCDAERIPGTVSKVTLSAAIARRCLTPADVPAAIRSAFHKVRIAAGVERAGPAAGK